MPLSLCNFSGEEVRGNNLKRFTCSRCGLLTPWIPIESKRVVRACEVPGVGGYLKDLVYRAGGRIAQGCGCEEMAAKMDAWGPTGCRTNRAEIVAKLQENAAKLGWWETVTMGAKLMQEPWFNPLDPAGSIVDEAIRRAEAKAPPREPSIWDQYSSE